MPGRKPASDTESVETRHLRTEFDQLIGHVQQVNACLHELQKNDVQSIEMAQFPAVERSRKAIRAFANGIVPATAGALGMSANEIVIELLAFKSPDNAMVNEQPAAGEVAETPKPAGRVSPSWSVTAALCAITALLSVSSAGLFVRNDPERIEVHKPILGPEVEDIAESISPKTARLLRSRAKIAEARKNKLVAEYLEGRKQELDERNRRGEKSERTRKEGEDQ